MPARTMAINFCYSALLRKLNGPAAHWAHVPDVIAPKSVEMVPAELLVKRAKLQLSCS